MRMSELRSPVLRGLYIITPEKPPVALTLAQAVAAALEGGATLVQYRNKTHNHAQRRAEALEILSLCRTQGVPLIVNDDVGLAREIGADGVHLGRDDAGIAEARSALGPRALIGVSCYASLERAIQAEAAGADYVAFGRFFPSQSKPEATPANPDLLRLARTRIRLPLVAIGGITPENGAALVAAGADILAIIQGVFGQRDIPGACLAFRRLFEPLDRLP